MTATAGDGVAQVSWNAVTGATSYTVYYAPAVSKSSANLSTTATGAEIHGLTNGVAYQFAVTASNANGESALSEVVSATPQAPAPPLTATVLPADGATGVSRNPQIQIALSRAVDATTVSAIASGSACAASTVQLSSDDFATCIPLPTRAATADTTFTFTLAAPLAGSTTFKLRLTDGVKDAAGLALAHVTTSSFTTAAALAVTAFAPSGADVARQPALSVTFNRDADPASVTAQTGAGACQGTLQLSSDSFATCVAMSAQPATTDNRTFTMTPATELSLGTAYVLRVTATVKDSDAVELGGEFRQTFTTRPSLSVLSTTPADGATGVSLRLATVLIKFSRDVGSEGFDSASDCSGTFSLSRDGFTSCINLTEPPAAVASDTVQLALDEALDPSATYKVRVRKNFTDVDGFGMDADFVSPIGFRMNDPVAIASVSPADGASNVAPDATISLTFSRPVDAATFSAAGTGCTGGTVLLTADAFSHCLAIASISPSTGSASTIVVTPAALLPSSQQIQVRLKAPASDADDAFLPDLTTAGFHTAAPAAVTGLAIGTRRLQSLSLTWSDSDIAFDHANVYLAAPNSGEYVLVSSAGNALGVPGFAVAPFASYDIRVRASDAYGHEGPPADLLDVVGGCFSGDPADFTAGQTLSGSNGDEYRLTWNADSLLAGVSKSDNTSLLDDGDALWIAIDTDNPALGDTNGETRTTSVGSNDVIWPFKADHVIALTQVGAASTAVSVHDAGVAGFNAISTDSFESGVDEMRIPAAAIGSPQHARFAFAVVRTGDGLVRSIAPLNSAATDVLGFFGSITASVNTGTSIFNPSQAGTSMTSPLAEAPSLVTISVQKSDGAALMVKGSLHPLSFTLSESTYALLDDGTHGDATAADHVFTGRFNFGGSSEQLYFRFDDGGTTEFSDGKDRLRGLSGSSETFPQLTFGTVWSASNPFTLNFLCTTGGSPVEVGGSYDLGGFEDSSGPDGAPVTLVGGTSDQYSATKSFSAHDLVNGTPLLFKMNYGGTNFENGAGSAHSLDDDVIGSATLQWTAGDGTNF